MESSFYEVSKSFKYPKPACAKTLKKLGAILGYLRLLLGQLGAILGHFRDLGLSCGFSSLLLGQLGAILDYFRPSWVMNTVPFAFCGSPTACAVGMPPAASSAAATSRAVHLPVCSVPRTVALTHAPGESRRFQPNGGRRGTTTIQTLDISPAHGCWPA